MKKGEQYESSEGNPFTEMVFSLTKIKGGYGFVSRGAIQKRVSLKILSNSIINYAIKKT